jgi:cysteinyl-tRNA synthetase
MFSLFKSPDVKRSKHPIYLFNTATRKNEEFQSLKDKEVTIYACGPTVYDHIHIGNLRAYLLPDLLQRVFLYNGYQVKLTINFTDFGHLTDDADSGEDKMMKGLRREGLPITIEAMRGFAQTYIESFKHDNDAFGNLTATHYTRASDYIQEQIKLIETLEEKGYTYTISDGIYFDISKFPSYGVLGNIDLSALKAGARVEVNQEKHHPADFALWKNGPLGWKSKWGLGFPGWHIECTAMAFATLGKQIDIHTGGEDLMYTHHNGEIAQAECITGKQYVKYWLHNAHIKINDEKIAKSAGNGLRLSDLVADGYTPEDYRYWLLQSHYRTTANFSYEALSASKQALLKLKRFVYEELADITPTVINSVYEERFMLAIHNDLDTPKAIAILWDVVKDNQIKVGEKMATIVAFDSILNIGLSKDGEVGRAELGFINQNDIPEDIQALLDQREVARIAHNWPEADRIRDTIAVQGFQLEDTPLGPKISRII